MNILERLTGWFKSDVSAPLSPELEDLREAIERGRRLKRQEHYEEALGAFAEAAALAHQLHDTGAGVAISLHRADTLTRLKRYGETHDLLTHLDREAASARQPNHQAYIHCALGTLAQAQGEWDTAQKHFETALGFAQAAASPGAEGRAQGHLADTYLHDGNASYGAHLLREALPKLNTGGDIELSSYFVGRLGEALIATGQEIEGRNLLGRALRLAEHMDYVTHKRLWLVALAGQATLLNQHADALRLYTSAADITDLSAATWESIRLLTQISRCHLRMSNPADALAFAQRAADLCTASDLTDTDSLVILSKGAMGIALRAAGQPDAALPILQFAIEHYSGLPLSPVDYSRVDLLRHLGAIQAEADHMQAALTTYQHALDHATQSGSRLDSAVIHRDIGILYAQQEHPHEAIRSWTTALDIYESEHQYGLVSRLYSDLGNLRRQMGFGRRAMQDYEHALTVLGSVEDAETRGIVLANAATIYLDYGDIQIAESFFVESIKLAQQTQDQAAEGLRRGNYGWFLLTTGRPQRAITTLEYARRQTSDTGQRLAHAVQTDSLGLAHHELSKYDTALDYHRQALTLLEGHPAGRWLHWIRANLGHTLIALDRLDEAAPLFASVEEAARASADFELIARALTGQGRLLLKHGALPTAEAVLADAVQQARRAGGRRLQAEALTLQSECFARSSRTAEAAAVWDEAKKLYSLLGVGLANVTPVWLR